MIREAWNTAKQTQPSAMEPSESTLEVRLVQLKITVERTEKILYAQSYEAIERHEIAIKTMISEVDKLIASEQWKRQRSHLSTTWVKLEIGSQKTGPKKYE